MISARIMILIMSIVRIVYEFILTKLADEQRKKPLPEEVADVYDEKRYQTYLDYVADAKKLSNKYMVINFIADMVVIFSPIYKYMEKWCNANPYMSFFGIYLVIWVLGTVIETCSSYETTFRLMEKYELNKKDLKEFIKDEVLQNILGIVLTLTLGELLVFVGEHMAEWTNNFSIGFIGSSVLCIVLLAVFFVFFCIAQLSSYFILRKQYEFIPLEDGELKDKINRLQESSKKKVKNIYVYNESKKTTMKNAFLLKLFWHKEFGIADNFMNENAEDELLAVLSHEIGHLKHKKNIYNFIVYALRVAAGLFAVLVIYKPSVFLGINEWVRNSFELTVNNYYLLIIVLVYIYKPLSYFLDLFAAYKSRWEEYEADREAVSNGYGEALIKTFKELSRDELINVNPHPYIEFTEYDHPGMYNRIKAIREAERVK